MGLGAGLGTRGWRSELGAGSGGWGWGLKLGSWELSFPFGPPSKKKIIMSYHYFDILSNNY